LENTKEDKQQTFIGFHTEIAPDDGCKKCPEFWDKEYESG
jgi:AraC family transcriptional regulator